MIIYIYIIICAEWEALLLLLESVRSGADTIHDWIDGNERVCNVEANRTIIPCKYRCPCVYVEYIGVCVSVWARGRVFVRMASDRSVMRCVQSHSEHEVWHVNMKSNDVFTASVTYTIFWTSNAFHKLNRTYVQNRFGFAFLQEQFDRNYILLFFIQIDAKLLFISRLYWSWSCSWSVSRCEYWRSLLVEPKTFRLEQ